MDLSLDKVPTPSQYAVSHGLKVTTLSNQWLDTVIKHMLLNEVYIGNMVQGRKRKICYKSKKVFNLPKEQWTVVQNKHEPIINKKTFKKAGQMVALRNQTRFRSRNYLLQGLVFCKECGKKMTVTTAKTTRGELFYFRCRTYVRYSRLGYCTSHRIKMDYVEKSVIDKVKNILRNYSDTASMIGLTKQKLKEQSRNNTRRHSDCNAKLAYLEAQINSIYNDKLNGILSQDDFIRIYESKKLERKKIQDEIDMLNDDKSNTIALEEAIINNLVKKFNTELIISREILTDLIDKIEIDENKKIYVYFKFNILRDSQ